MPPKGDSKGEGKRDDQSVRLHGDVVRLARIIAAYTDDSMSDLISKAVRPILAERLKELQKKGFDPGAPPKK